MANICLNYLNAFGDADAINKLRQHLIYTTDVEVVGIGSPCEEDDLVKIEFSVESRWSPPVEWVSELSEMFSVLFECEYEEQSSDIWGKFGFRNGELLFTMELPYLEGKHKSMVWNEFLECEVLYRLEEEISLEEFLEDFPFCNEDEINELKQIYNGTN